MPASWIDAAQWPAMALTTLGAWLVASRSRPRRRAGFWIFLASNALWALWGWSVSATALIALQFALAALNVRGVFKNDETGQGSGTGSPSTPAGEGRGAPPPAETG